MRGLAKAHVSYRAHMQLGFFVTALLGSSEVKVKHSLAPPHDLLPKNLQDVQCLLRLLGPVSKATTAKAAVIGTQTAMESLGNVGYFVNEEIEFNVARLARDCAVLCIGEGTTDVLATDVVKVLKEKIGSYVMKALEKLVKGALANLGDLAMMLQDEKNAVVGIWNELDRAITGNSLIIFYSTRERS
jgi:hypothetical protein